MNVSSALLWGFVATIALTTIMAASHGMGWTRISIPFLVGTIVTRDRDRALVWGIVLHLVNGWLFALLYVAMLESLGWRTWWLGAGIGFAHAAFVLAVGMPILPGLHPHMVSEYFGPAPNRRLQPPGFMALNYGKRTPVVTIVAHIAYGAIIGACYELVAR